MSVRQISRAFNGTWSLERPLIGFWRSVPPQHRFQALRGGTAAWFARLWRSDEVQLGKTARASLAVLRQNGLYRAAGIQLCKRNIDRV